MGRRLNRRRRAFALRTMRKPEPQRSANRQNNNARRLARRESAFRNIVISAERLRERAQHRVTNQINGKNLPIEFLPSKQKNQQPVKSEVERRFVKLHRMNCQPVRGVIERKVHRPRLRTGIAITTSRHKTTNPSKRVAKRNARRHHVRDLPKRQTILPTINNRSQRRANQPAIKNQTMPTHRDDVIQRFISEFVAPKSHHKQQPRPNDRPKNNPRRQIRDRILRKILASAPTAPCPKSRQKSNGGKDAVPIDRKTKNLECFRMHAQ